jgi:hypothetical protein
VGTAAGYGGDDDRPRRGARRGRTGREKTGAGVNMLGQGEARGGRWSRQRDLIELKRRREEEKIREKMTCWETIQKKDT